MVSSGRGKSEWQFKKAAYWFSKVSGSVLIRNGLKNDTAIASGKGRETPGRQLIRPFSGMAQLEESAVADFVGGWREGESALTFPDWVARCSALFTRGETARVALSARPEALLDPVKAGQWKAACLLPACSGKSVVSRMRTFLEKQRTIENAVTGYRCFDRLAAGQPSRKKADTGCRGSG